MVLKFGDATIQQLRYNVVAYDKDSGLYFRPMKIQAMEGGSLQRETVNGQTILDSFGHLVLQKSQQTTGPYYFHIAGVNVTASSLNNRLVDLIVPFDNAGKNASTSRLDVVG
jgi:hypothetical protein